MKVIHFISQGDVGGAKTHILSLLGQLKGEADVTLVSLARSRFSEEAAELGVPVLTIPAPLRHLPQLIKLAKSADILHCHGAKANVVGALLKFLTGKPVATTIHSDFRLDYLGRPLRQATIGNVNRLALRLLDWYIPVSRNLGDLLIRCGYAPQRVLGVHNCLDFDNIPPRADRPAFFAQYGFDVAPDDVVVSFAGRLTPVKDVPTLLRGFAAAHEQCPKLKLFIAGGGEEEARLKALADSLGIAGCVCFAGWVDRVLQLYSVSDVCVMSSKSEGFPYSLLEGAMYGVPTAATAVGGIPDFIEDGKTGFLYAPGDDSALTDILVRLCRDPGLRLHVGQAGFEKAKAEYSLPAMKRDQLSVYRRILAQSERPRRDGAVICGAYGKGNMGDEAILRAIIAELRAIDPAMPITVMSREPEETRLAYRTDAIFTFNVPGMLRAFRRSALYINGGGSLIQDVTSSRSLYFYLFTLAAAHLCRSRVMMYGCGIGPLGSSRNRRLAARILNRHVDVITLREDESAAELAAMEVDRPRIRLAADPALTLQPADPVVIDRALAAAGLSRDGQYLCICVRPWKGFEAIAPAIAAAADYAYDRYGLETVLLPIEVPRDLAAADTVASLMAHTPHIIRESCDARVCIGLLSCMRGVLAMRLHALVFAASRGIPIAGIVYDKKVEGFLRYLGQPLYAGFEDATPEKLRDFVDTLAATPAGALAENAARLRRLESVNSEEAAQLLGM